MPSLFTRIIQGEIPCHRVAEDDHHIAFLDINPVQRGHTLCVPKQQIDYIFDLEDDALTALTLFSKRVARGLGSVIDCNRIGVSVIGLEVPHTHIHLIPINGLADINFESPRVAMDSDEMAELAARIERAIKLPG
jgi:histidine triad (HIT) family protein